MRSRTDQDGVFCALFLIPQLADVKVRIVRRLEHVCALLLLVVGTSARLKVRGREVGFLQQRRA